MKTLTVVVSTRNEEANIAACLESFADVRDEVELVVVDNASTDRTREIARAAGARVAEKGPERCAQRNLGWRLASSEWVIILDADMILPRETVTEILATAKRGASAPDACWIPEVRTGGGLRTKARNFERSFYDGTCIDALRLFRRRTLEAVGGYDENLTAGGEDWELDIRILATGARAEILSNPLWHNERQLSVAKLLAKKAYYARGIALYRAKWPDHPSVRLQFSPVYRFVGVFVENGKWRRLLRHPILAAVMYAERLAVACTYLVCRMTRNAKGESHA